jgi:hypothetical protein
VAVGDNAQKKTTLPSFLEGMAYIFPVFRWRAGNIKGYNDSNLL